MIKKMNKILIVCISFIILSCQHQQSTENTSLGKYYQVDEAMEEEEAMQAPRSAEPPSPDTSLDAGSKIIKTGHMSFEVSQLETTKSKIDSIVKSIGAYYENEHYQAYGNRIKYSLQIRIPNVKFDSMLLELENGIGVLTSKHLNAQDVTEEYVDLNIRLENNLAYLAQYQSILKRANSIQEVLDVQEKIRRIEEEIESKKGRIKYLNNNVKYSTLNLEISELISRDISNKPKFGRRVANAFNSGIQGFLSITIAIISLWPLILLILFVYLIRKPILKSIKRRKRNPIE